SPGKGIHIVKQPKPSLEAFVDADWAKCIFTRKSETGLCVKLNGSLVSWKNEKQNTLSKSSAEAEYRAIASVTSEIVWILKILKELNWKHLLPVNLFCDSQAAIKIAVNPVFLKRWRAVAAKFRLLAGYTCLAYPFLGSSNSHLPSTFLSSVHSLKLLLLGILHHSCGICLVLVQWIEIQHVYLFEAKSAIKVEGAVLEDGRTLSIWDTYAHLGYYNGANGDIACDGYHKYK
nr:ribonuclease H-like domain-containing protein [Tanacetum cinerariifolium]